mmetsp:Transcript_12418/g.34230  ORF Transcript_12418/g.34230 Transcript_12418/m.34230 type:complete len:91 (+) Transcript_12418:603-875(+)
MDDDDGKLRVPLVPRDGHMDSNDRGESAGVYHPHAAPGPGIPDANAPGKSNEFRCQRKNPCDWRAQSRSRSRVDGVRAPSGASGPSLGAC